MRKILLLIGMILSVAFVHAQCVVTASPNTTIINCDDSIFVTLSSFGDTAFNCDFNGGLCPGFDTVGSAAQINSTCIPQVIPTPPDNSDYLWLGNLADIPRGITTPTIDVSLGGQVCFDMIMAVQGGGCSNAEGPDLSEEGISFQYTIDGGATWVDIIYFSPEGTTYPTNPGPGGAGSGGGATPYTSWNTYCYIIPPLAQTTGTSFRWIQLASSTTDFDHWGLDDLQILVNDPTYDLTDADGNIISSTQDVITPTSDSLIVYTYTNGVDDTCTAQFLATVNPTDVGPALVPSCEGIGEPIEVTGVSPWSTISWSPALGLTSTNTASTFANPANDQTYTVTSNCGVDSLFLDVVPSFTPSIAVPDTVCVYGQTDLIHSTTPSTVPIAMVSWDDPSTLNSPTGSTVQASPYVTLDYVATAVSDSGCVRRDTVKVYVDGLNFPIEITPMDTQVCVGDPADLSADWVEPTEFYDVQSVGFDPIDNPGTGTVVTGLADDQVSGPIPLGFTFEFYGNAFTEVFLSSNGWLRFGFVTDSDPTPDPIPSVNGNENIIAFAWSDLNFLVGGTAEYYTVGTSPNQAFVMEFTDVNYSGSVLNTVSVQVVLFESGIIQMNNINIQTTGSNMTQGIENLTASEGAFIPGHNNVPFVSQNESWIFIPFSPPETPSYVWSPGTYLNSTTDSLVTSTPATDINYNVIVSNGYCQSTASTNVYIDTTAIVWPADTSSCSASDTFQLEVLTNASAITNCNYTLNMYDGGGSSWFSTEAVEILINGVLFNSFAHTGGASSSVSFNVPAGQTLEVRYIADLGSADNAYDLVNYDGDTVWTDGPSPTPGIVYSELTCNGGFIYEWESLNGATFNDTTLSNPEVYTVGDEVITVTVTNRIGCVFTHDVIFSVINGFNLEVTPDTIICMGDSLQLFSSPGADGYVWTPNMDITDVSISDPIVFPTSTTTYTVVVDSSGCLSTDQVLVEVSDVTIDNVITSDISCAAPGDIVIQASGGYPGYTYSIDDISYFPTDTFNVNVAGNYNVSVQDSVGCIASQVAAVGQLDSFIIDSFIITDILCFGDSTGAITFYGLGGTAPYEYSIDNGVTYASSGMFTNLGAGNYSLLLRDAQMCNSSFELVTIAEPTDLVLALDTSVGATCGTPDGSLVVSATGGAGSYQYTLDAGTPQSTGTFNNLGGATYELVVSDANGCTDTLQVLVAQSSDVAIALIDFDSVSCNGADDAFIEVQVTNGTTPYQLTLNSATIGAGTDTLFTGLGGGMYTIEVTDSLGCTANVNATIFEPALLDLTVTPTAVSCFGGNDGELLLAATGGTTPLNYSITTDTDLQLGGAYNTLTAGNYTAYVVDANGCRDTTLSTITEPAAPLSIDAVTVQNIDCFGDDDGSITITVSGGTTNYEYSIDNITFGTSNSIGNLDGGFYTVYVRDANACTIDTPGIEITEPTDLTLVLASSSAISCNNGSDGELTVTAGGGTPSYSYSITGGGTQASNIFTGLSAGNYTITVTDSSGCIENIATNLANPAAIVPTISTVSITCSGDNNGSISIDNVTGGIAPYTISFDGDPALPLATNSTFIGLGEGIYTIEIIDDLGCSSGVQNANLTNPNALVINAVTVTDISCFGLTDGEVDIDASGGTGTLTYFVALPSGDTLTNTTGDFVGLDANTVGYPLWVQDVNGCVAQDNAVVNEPLEISIDSTYLTPLSCFGYDDAEIQVFGSGGAGQGNYNFTLADGTPAVNGFVFTGLNSGSYWIYLTDINGCQDSVRVDVVNPPPVIASIEADTTVLEMGESADLDASLDNATGDLIYFWTPSGGLSCTDCSNPTALIYNDQEFTVTITDSLGCNDDASVDIDVLDELFYFVPNAFTPSNGDETNDKFKVEGKDVKFVEMMVFNRWGEKVYESANPFGGWDGTYKGVMQQPGVYTYFVKITFLNDKAIESKGSVTLIR